jgi:hypothetical protein
MIFSMTAISPPLFSISISKTSSSHSALRRAAVDVRRIADRNDYRRELSGHSCVNNGSSLNLTAERTENRRAVL